MATRKDDSAPQVIEVKEVQLHTVPFCVIGRTPLMFRRMALKGMGDILAPTPRKNAAEKQSTLKHNPPQEYRDSPYTLPDGSPTLLAVMSAAFKRAMMTAALDLPGTKKAQIGRLLWVEEDRTPIYGVPQMVMMVTRMSDNAHTPDVPSKAIVRSWAARLTITFAGDLIKLPAVTHLLAFAGRNAGIGDGRTEKGHLDYGQFAVTNEEDPDFQRIIATGGREAQIDAMARPTPYDDDTRDLFRIWYERSKAAGFDVEELW